MWKLYALVEPVARFIQLNEADEVGEILIDFIPYDAQMLNILGRGNVMLLWLQMLKQVSDPELLSRIPEVYEGYVLPHQSALRLVPLALSNPLDAWLWNIVRDPLAHGVETSRELNGVYRTMANRNADNFLPYSRGVVYGEIKPAVNIDGGLSIRRYARGTLAILKEKVLERRERLLTWVQRLKNGDRTVLEKIYWEIIPADDFLIPALSALSSEHWRAAEIMERVPDPAFLTRLVEWARGPNPSYLLEAIVACGGQKEAIKIAKESLPRDPRQIDVSPLRQFSLEASRIVLFLGKQEDPALADHFLAYLDRETLGRFEYSEMGPKAYSEIPVPNDFWQFRDAALIALARSGHVETIPRLKSAYETEYIRGKITASFALHSLGDDTGIEIVNAFREKRELSIPEVSEHWYLEVYSRNAFEMAVEHLESRSVDEVYLARWKEGYELREWERAHRTGLIDRNRCEVYNILLSGIDEPNFRGIVVACLKSITGQDFGFSARDLFAHQQPAIQKWKEYVATL